MREIKNIAASVAQRLKNRAVKEGILYNDLLLHYGIERFLYRLSQSTYKSRFILKGGLVLYAFDPAFSRETRDIDLLAYAVNTVDNLKAIIEEICATDVEADGIKFDADSLQGRIIKERDKYSGVRVKFIGNLGNTRIPMQVDIGFGDVITPSPVETNYPTILENVNSPHLRVYPPETILAEKIHALVKLDLLNSRLRDFYDIWYLTETRKYDGRAVSQAVKATFQHRETEVPAHLSDEWFATYTSNDKKQQWSTLKARLSDQSPLPALSDTLHRIQAFTAPLFEAISSHRELEKKWEPRSGWM